MTWATVPDPGLMAPVIVAAMPGMGFGRRTPGSGRQYPLLRLGSSGYVPTVVTMSNGIGGVWCAWYIQR